MAPSRLLEEDESIRDVEAGLDSDISGETCRDVVIVGAGPAGLMLAANLARFGIDVEILDDRAEKTTTGRADGLQPKTIETLRQMRLADPVLRKGVRIYDICFWSSSLDESLRRTGRAVHYPKEHVQTDDPYILLVHQGMVEVLFLDDLETRAVEVSRNSPFLNYSLQRHFSAKDLLVNVEHGTSLAGEKKTLSTRFLVGCDGAHSQVRKSMPGVQAVGGGSEAIWGVLDGEIETDFPDLWSKVVIHSEIIGSVLCIPRERNMTRLYIELRSEGGQPVSKADLTQEYVMKRANQILSPFRLTWRKIEWFGIYKIGQRVANRFTDETQRVFIAGDASHTHSPKAAQGMNTSMHDSWNLAWKLNLVIRGLASSTLLSTYEHERRKIALDLIKFDIEHSNAFAEGDPVTLAKNFDDNIRFISGVGVEYDENCLNRVTETINMELGELKPGCLLPSGRVTRYVDANPVDIQLDIPMLGQYRTYFFVPDLRVSMNFLNAVCGHISNPSNLQSQITQAATISQSTRKTVRVEADEYIQPERYSTVSSVFTYALITSTPKAEVEIADLPELLQKSHWTFYLDDLASGEVMNGETNYSCTAKWFGKLRPGEAAVVNVRPDGYVGSVRRWASSGTEEGAGAGRWLDNYFGRFLEVS